MFHPEGPTFLELTQQALSSTERGYDLLAPKFDVTPFRTPDWLLQAVSPLIAAKSPVHDGLDLCCGTGAATAMLTEHCRQRVVGVDFSDKMLEVARQNLSACRTNVMVEYQQLDVLQLDLQEEFDLATCFGALGHILPQDQHEFARRVYRALRRGGRFIFATGYLPPRLSKRYLLSRGFNAAMRIRNWLVRPPFVMYYLTFLVPQANEILQDVGFQIAVHGDLPFREMCIVEATKA